MQQTSGFTHHLIFSETVKVSGAMPKSLARVKGR
jgi:hypothetical protein